MIRMLCFSFLFITWPFLWIINVTIFDLWHFNIGLDNKPHRDLHDVKLQLTSWCISLYVPNLNDIKHYMVSEQNWTTIPTTGSSGASHHSWRSDASSRNITHHSNLHAACKLAHTQAPLDGQQFSHQLEHVEESVDKICTDQERASCHHMVLSQIWPVHIWSWRRTHRFRAWATPGSIQEANTPITKALTENKNGTAELFSGH